MELGDPLHVRMSKWGERPHWEFRGLWLGSDDLGDWVGTPAGTHHHRPGMEFHSDVDTVTLFPRERWWAATFHAPGIWCTAYVDMTTPPVLEPGPDGVEVRCVDLDLDVIRLSEEHGGTWYVDDEDEFAEHQVAFGYPPEVVAAAEASRDEVWAAAHAGTGAFDGRAQAWLDRLDQWSTRTRLST